MKYNLVELWDEVYQECMMSVVVIVAEDDDALWQRTMMSSCALESTDCMQI